MRRHGLDGRNDNEIGVGDLLLVEKIQIDVIHLRHKQIRLLLYQRVGLDDRLGGLGQRFPTDHSFKKHSTGHTEPSLTSEFDPK